MSSDESGFGSAAGNADADRGWDEVLADAVRVLTEAARLRRPAMEHSASGAWEPHPTRTEPADWAEFVTLALAGAAANVGSVDRALEGRPGSWEADAVRSLLDSTVGHDSAHLMEHRTEPVRVTLRPAEILADLGYAGLYEDSRQALAEQQDRHLWRYRLGENRERIALDPGAPDWADAFDGPPPQAEDDQLYRPGVIVTVPRSAADEAVLDVLYDREAALDDLQYEDDPRAYGQALKATVLAEAARTCPGVPVEITIDTDERTCRDDSPYWGEVPEERLIDAAVNATPLPWSGIAPKDYPPGQSPAAAERAAGRLPHLRLGQAAGAPPEEGKTP